MDAAKRLRELRLAKNLTMTELAIMCDMQQSAISKLENNKRVIDLPTLMKICKALDMSLGDFFCCENIPMHLYELVWACKDLSPEQVSKITLAIKGLLGQ